VFLVLLLPAARAHKGAELTVSPSCPTQNPSRARAGKSPSPAYRSLDALRTRFECIVPNQGSASGYVPVADSVSLVLVSIPAVSVALDQFLSDSESRCSVFFVAAAYWRFRGFSSTQNLPFAASPS
jgi:hypothetical protein